MTAKLGYQHFRQALLTIYDSGEAEQIASMVFANMAGLTRSQLISNPDNELPFTTQTSIDLALQQLLQHRPVQYVLGEAWFCGQKFEVNEAVLIPRPETEELVHIAGQFLQPFPKAKVLDIGTGSGCIAISLKMLQKSAVVDAVDKSKIALDLAQVNAQRLGVDVNFIEADFLEPAALLKSVKYQLILSNPPYIPAEESSAMQKQVTEYEPHMALFVPNDNPLLFYNSIAKFALTQLEKNGMVLVETHFAFAEAVAECFSSVGFKSEVVQDMFGKNRFVQATHYPTL